MTGRTLTNLLLALIAGALLFGRDAMVGGLQGALIGGASVVAIFAVLMSATGLFKVASAWPWPRSSCGARTTSTSC